MKKFAEISYLLAVAVLLPVAFSCSDDVQEEVPVGNNRMSVNIYCSDMTKATEAGSEAFNENLLNTLDIFYYRTASDADCFAHDRVSDLSGQGSATYTKYLEILTKEKFFGTGDTGSCYVYVIANGPQTDIDSLLNNNNASVANLKKIVLFSPDLGNSEVQSDMGTKLVRQETFVMDGGATMTYSNGSATVDVKLARSLSKIQLYVHFPDSVIVNGKTYKPSIISVNSTAKKAWGKAVFNNGLKRGYVNDSTARHYTPSDDDYYPASGLSYDAKARYIRSDTLSIIRTSNGKTYYTHSPFYTYPMTWDTFSGNLSTRPTTLMLVVDWYSYESTGGMTSKTTFYTIDVNSSQADDEEYKFKRNTFYKLYVDVNTIGSDTSTDPIEISGDCEILDWNHVNQETSIENLRYLTVDENDYVMDNEETLYIPYSTSHDCEISEITATRLDLTGNIVSTLVLTEGETISVSDNVYSIADGYDFLDPQREFSIEIDDDYLIFSHSLENRESVEDTLFDYVPFEVTFTVRHKDDYSYSETIHIKQHPELSIEAQTNSDFESDPVSSEDNDYEGYVFVNGYNHPLGEGYGYLGSPQVGEKNSLSDSEETDQIYPRGLFKTDSGVYYTYYSNYFQNSGSVNEAFLGRKTGIISSSTVENQNPNRYLIRAAVASGESQYIIGNPLSDNVDNMPLVLESSVEPRITTIGAPTLSAGEHTWSKDARYLQADGSISDDTRMLTYYRPGRPSDESPSSTNVVAPRFMVASSYGVTTSLLRENAKRRCASYQEEGYPAGRWRLPTTAEVMYCIQLTRNGMIPRLFGTNGTNAVAIFRNSAYYTTTGYVISNWDTGEEVISSGEGDIPGTNLFYKWVRCVYDVWYWGEDMPLEPETFTNGDGTEVTGYRFTWGDMQ